MWFIGVEVEQETSAPPPKKKSWIRPCLGTFRFIRWGPGRMSVKFSVLLAECLLSLVMVRTWARNVLDKQKMAKQTKKCEMWLSKRCSLSHMSSASSWGRTRGIVSWQFPPGVREINEANWPGSSASQWKILLISTSRKLGFISWLIHLNFNDTCSLLSWQNLLCTTVNKDHKSIREMNLAIT